MRIMTEAEYERRLEAARQEGWTKRCEAIERDRFREDLWSSLREMRQDLDRQIRAMNKAMVKAGIEDPFEPKGACCDGTCTPVIK